MLAIGVAAGFYCLVVIATAIMVPWPSLPPNSLAFVEATRQLPWGRALVPLVLAIAMLSLVKTWNGVFLMASRTLIALAREGFLPAWMNRWHGRSGVPAPVVLVIFVLNIAGLTLGRGAVGLLSGHHNHLPGVRLCHLLHRVADSAPPGRFARRCGDGAVCRWWP